MRKSLAVAAIAGILLSGTDTFSFALAHSFGEMTTQQVHRTKLNRPSQLRHPERQQSAIDHSGRTHTGKASVYSHRFDGKHMANGRRFDPRSNSVASKSLPIGTVAKVTNLRTGKTATVTVADRGPYVKGRIADVSPATAQQLGIGKKDGIAPVAVAPLSTP
jgi:rare lipoprotein A